MNRENNNKYNLNPKYIKCAGCPKPAGPRWSEKLEKFCTAFRGPNNTELCCKCAEKEEFYNVCYKCNRKGQRRTSFGLSGLAHLCIKDKDNPSGEWWVYCCNDCLPADYPQRWGEMVWENGDNTHYHHEQYKPNPPFEGKPNPSSDSNNQLKPNPGVEENSKCALKECGKIVKSGQVCFNVHFPNELFCSYECCDKARQNIKPNPGSEKEDISTNNHTQRITSNPPSNQQQSPNIKVIKGESSSEKNPPNPTSEKSPNQTDNETLIINLKNVKQITQTAEGNLVIEFINSKQGNSYSISQTITPDQINHSQELKTIESYLKKNGQTSLSQQELDSIFNKSKSSVSKEKPQGDNNALLIGSIAIGTLIMGIGIGLFLQRKTKVKKVN